MTWTYADWITIDDPAARLARLRLHEAEVGASIGASVAGDGHSADFRTLETTMARLRTERLRLEAIVGTDAPTSSYASFRRA